MVSLRSTPDSRRTCWTPMFLILTGLFKVVLGAFFGRDIYVPLKMNWLEARKICRRYYTDLVTARTVTWSACPLDSALAKTLQTNREAQTGHVWIGLRYLAGSWLWVDGEKMEYKAWSQGKTQQCPNRGHHCGALPLEGQHWDSQDCVNKFNFVCN
uniref:C-type lectin domain-containing protein n=1 Tax=Seriola dumerili TaxID=41447 RepID=A0A3B4V4K3_SERDU